MKKILLILFVTFTAAAVNAQVDTTNATSQPNPQYNAQDQQSNSDKEIVATSDLPELVKESLKSPDFAGWTTGNAYKKERGGKVFYAVELKRGSETKMIKFDSQGNKIREKDKK